MEKRQDLWITKTNNGWHVCLKKEKNIWGLGISLEEAIGNMIRSNLLHFGFSMLYNLEDPTTKKHFSSKKKGPRRRKYSRIIKRRIGHV